MNSILALLIVELGEKPGAREGLRDGLLVIVGPGDSLSVMSIIRSGDGIDNNIKTHRLEVLPILLNLPGLVFMILDRCIPVAGNATADRGL